MIEKITLVIPTHKRHRYLKRILDYYSYTDLKILVADSSNTKFKNSSNYTNVSYFHYPRKTYSEKMFDIINKVKTKYVVLSPDDDFIIPAAIISCAKFLEKNEEYYSAQGHYVSFLNRKGIIYSPVYLHSVGLDINSNKARKRLEQLYMSYMFLYYSVHKTENLKTIFKLAYKKIENLNLIELLIAIIGCINGKHKVLPIFYCARENMVESAGNYTPTLDELIKNQIYSKEYNYLVKCTSKYLSDMEKIKFSLAEKIIMDTIKIERNSNKKSQSTMKIILIHKIDSISKFFGNSLRKIYFFIDRIRNILLTKKMEGFPFYDPIAKRELKKIDYFIKKYNIQA